ncbi:hypothetical protein Pint_26556 [Pistacia integerrima]|uniref:Uncharacterized protein n=1 Tax=Pistacia integerrima TaxID=434235 RepID=A0ACC0YMU2_9ROSI|nr:hypothetical protein Pint_26556 [Pistacia integerrima]
MSHIFRLGTRSYFKVPNAERSHILQSESEIISTIEGKSIHADADECHVQEKFGSEAVEIETRINGCSISTQPHLASFGGVGYPDEVPCGGESRECTVMPLCVCFCAKKSVVGLGWNWCFGYVDRMVVGADGRCWVWGFRMWWDMGSGQEGGGGFGVGGLRPGVGGGVRLWVGFWLAGVGGAVLVFGLLAVGVSGCFALLWELWLMFLRFLLECKIEQLLKEEGGDWGQMSIRTLEDKFSAEMTAEVALLCVDINYPDVNGWTALHWAAYCHRKHTVEFLISKGATPGILSLPPPNYHREKTPADLAFATGHKEICDYLEEKVELAVASLELL